MLRARAREGDATAQDDGDDEHDEDGNDKAAWAVARSRCRHALPLCPPPAGGRPCCRASRPGASGRSLCARRGWLSGVFWADRRPPFRDLHCRIRGRHHSPSSMEASVCVHAAEALRCQVPLSAIGSILVACLLCGGRCRRGGHLRTVSPLDGRLGAAQAMRAPPRHAIMMRVWAPPVVSEAFRVVGRSKACIVVELHFRTHGNASRFWCFPEAQPPPPVCGAFVGGLSLHLLSSLSPCAAHSS